MGRKKILVSGTGTRAETQIAVRATLESGDNMATTVLQALSEEFKHPWNGLPTLSIQVNGTRPS